MAAVTSEQKWQLGCTFTVGALFCYFMWPKMDTVSKGIVGMFAVVACLSIQQGTWMLNHRDMRRQDRDARREAYRAAKGWLGFGRGKGKVA